MKNKNFREEGKEIPKQIVWEKEFKHRQDRAC